MPNRPPPLPTEAESDAASALWRAVAAVKRAYQAYEEAFAAVVLGAWAIMKRAYQRTYRGYAATRAFIEKTWTDHKTKQQAKADHEKEQRAKEALRAAAETAAAQQQNGKAAAEALRFARSYLDDWYKDGGSVSQMHDAVKFATKYLQQARALNPMVGLTVEGKNGPVSYTQDELAAEALYLEATLSEGSGEHDFQLQNAFEALKKAAAYNPTAPHIHRRIAEVLLKMHKRSDALKAAQFALSLDPTSIDSRKLYDKIDATPSLGVKQNEPGGILAGIAKFFYALAFIFGLLLPGLTILQGDIGSAIGGALVIGFPLLLIGGKFSDWAMGQKLLSKAFEREHYKG